MPDDIGSLAPWSPNMHVVVGVSLSSVLDTSSRYAYAFRDLFTYRIYFYITYMLFAGRVSGRGCRISSVLISRIWDGDWLTFIRSLWSIFICGESGVLGFRSSRPRRLLRSEAMVPWKRTRTARSQLRQLMASRREMVLFPIVEDIMIGISLCGKRTNNTAVSSSMPCHPAGQ